MNQKICSDEDESRVLDWDHQSRVPELVEQKVYLQRCLIQIHQNQANIQKMKQYISQYRLKNPQIPQTTLKEDILLMEWKNCKGKSLDEFGILALWREIQHPGITQDEYWDELCDEKDLVDNGDFKLKEFKYWEEAHEQEGNNYY